MILNFIINCFFYFLRSLKIRIILFKIFVKCFNKQWLKNYLLNLIGYRQNIEIILFKFIFLFFILKPIFDILKSILICFFEVYGFFISIIFNIIFEFGIIFKTIGNLLKDFENFLKIYKIFSTIFYFFLKKYNNIFKRLYEFLIFDNWDMDTILNLSIQRFFFKLFDNILLLFIKILDFLFFNVTFVVGYRRIFLYIRHLYFYLKIIVLFIFKYIFITISNFLLFLHWWKNFKYRYYFNKYLRNFLKKNRRFQLGRKAFQIEIAIIYLKLEKYIKDTSFDINKKLVEKKKRRKYLLKYIFLKILLSIFYFLFFYYSIVITIIILLRFILLFFYSIFTKTKGEGYNFRKEYLKVKKFLKRNE